MARFTATPVLGLGGFDISELDADGMGRRHLFVVNDRSATMEDAQKAVRVLCLALSLDGGLDRALELLRSEAVRQNT